MLFVCNFDVTKIDSPNLFVFFSNAFNLCDLQLGVVAKHETLSTIILLGVVDGTFFVLLDVVVVSIVEDDNVEERDDDCT